MSIRKEISIYETARHDGSGMKNLGQMMRQAQEMQERLTQMQTRLSELEITGSSGGGMVEVTLSGKHEANGFTLCSE